jgi:hypothetical protein
MAGGVALQSSLIGCTFLHPTETKAKPITIWLKQINLRLCERIFNSSPSDSQPFFRTADSSGDRSAEQSSDLASAQTP